MKILRLILGDQLNATHSWFDKVDPEVTYVLMEVRTETDYVCHHVQKVVAFFLAMRNFASELESEGHRVRYLKLNDPLNAQNFPENLRRLLAENRFDQFEYQLPDEYRLDQVLKKFAQSLEIPVKVADTEHFLTSRSELADFFSGKKQFLMEYYYRHLRKKYGILMDGGKPVGGQWNFDADNRNRYKGEVPVPPAPRFRRDISVILKVLNAAQVETLGRIEAGDFGWAVTRQEGLEVLEHFCGKLLPWFGQYQDALTSADPYLFHSRLSFLMNVKLLSPLEVVQAAIQAWEKAPERISLNQIEGFVRQIIGWREYMRGIYWAKMPEYAKSNFFGHERNLPQWYWTGKTRMNCLRHSIGQSLELAYAHHIQRLMVTGNFALLIGTHPDEVDAWYLGIYIDALEWVEITNTRGMSQFADGGIVASKPYVCSANYIHKMGDYCRSCAYDHASKTETDSCPLNSLYWHFFDRHRAKLERNPRLAMIYRGWDRMNRQERAAILAKAASLLETVNRL